MTIMNSQTEELLREAIRGNADAVEVLLARYRERLQRMVAVRMDRRLRRRVDPSDIVQETLMTAVAKLPEFVRDRPLPFVAWLRCLALERVAQIHRYHIRTSKRAVGREAVGDMALPADSAVHLIDLVADRGSSPSRAAIREEQRQRMRSKLQQLPTYDLDVLVMRYLEHLPLAEIAETLGVGLSAIKMRHFRAVQRLRALIDDDSAETGR